MDCGGGQELEARSNGVLSVGSGKGYISMATDITDIVFCEGL